MVFDNELKRSGIKMLSSEQNVQVSDTTKAL